MSHETYTIVLRALPGDSRPAVYRIRGLLKYALRAMRLRCVTISQQPVQVAQDDLEGK